MPQMRHSVLGRLDRSLRRSVVSAALAVCAVLSVAAPASAQLRVVTYNLVSLLGDPTAVNNVLIALHNDNKPGFATPVGIFLFCEVHGSDVAGIQAAVNAAAPAGISYALATFTTSGTEDSASGAQAIFYRTDLLTEITSGHLDIATGASRNADRWLFQLNGYTSTAARFYIYGAHLKASTGSANEATRLSGVQAIRSNADALGAGVRAIYGGDMNFYTNTETGYVAYMASGNGAAIDPLGTGNWTGSANSWMHTQSPRDIIAGGLVGGGLDDRFDFLLPTSQLIDGSGLSLISNTYRVPGNDGNHYNLAINAGNNTYYPTDLARSNALANNLFLAADHMPVMMDMRFPAWNTAVLGTLPTRIVQGAAGVVAPVRVANDAPGDSIIGVDPLLYTVTGSGVLSGALSGTAVLTPSFTTVNVPVVSSIVGLRTGTATVTSTNEAVQNPSIALPVSIRVVRASNPSFSATIDSNTLTVPITALLAGPAVDAEFNISNFGFTTDQATLDIDSVQIPSGPFSYVSGTSTGIGSGVGTVRVRFNPTGLTPGTYTAIATISTSDENIPGATNAQVVATLSATIGGGNPADLNGDGIVDGADLGLLLAQWGGTGTADFNRDGSVNGSDLGFLLGQWG